MTPRKRPPVWKAGHERMIAQCAQLLTVSLTETLDFPYGEVFQRLQAQVADNDPAGRRWIVAVRRVHAKGHLTDDQADALIHHIAELVTRTYDGAGLTFEEATTRHDGLACALLRTLGEERLAGRIESEGRDFRVRSLDALTELWRKDSAEGPGWRVAYPSPEGPVPERPVKRAISPVKNASVEADAGDDADDEDDDDEDDDEAAAAGDPDAGDAAREKGDDDDDDDEDADLAGRVEQWRQAANHVSMWTVAAVLNFAWSGAYGNEDGDGDKEIASIQCARDLELIDKELAYMLLDRIADAMIGDMESDPVLHGIEEQMEEMGLDSGWDGADKPGEDPRTVAGWKALRAAQVRREELIKREILRARGEEEMAHLMEHSPEEFRAGLAETAKLWDVE